MSVAPAVEASGAAVAEWSLGVVSACVSARKIHRPRLSDDHYFDLSRILELGFDASRDLLRERGHPNVVNVVRRHQHTNLTTGLDREHLVHTTIARRDPLEPFQALHIRLERF